MIATAIDYQKLQDCAQNLYVAISGCRSLSQSPRANFFALGVVENPRFLVGIVILSVIVPGIKVFPILGPHFPFRSFIVAITWRRFIRACLVENSRFAVGIVVIYVILSVSTSGLHGHIAISGYPSMSHLFLDTFFGFGVVENFVYRARITVITILQICSAV